MGQPHPLKLVFQLLAALTGSLLQFVSEVPKAGLYFSAQVFTGIGGKQDCYSSTNQRTQACAQHVIKHSSHKGLLGCGIIHAAFTHLCIIGQNDAPEFPLSRIHSSQFSLKSMLYLAAGMPRAGSGWHYNLLHDLLLAAGGQDARKIRRSYLLHPFLTEVNCNIRTLSARRLLPVLLPARLGNTFAIKTHSAPSPLAERLMRRGQLRVSYIYRDPRAALLSALEYGQRARAAGRSNAFSPLESFEDALNFIFGYLHIWERWMALDGLQSLSYESLLQNYEEETQRLIAFLEIDKQTAAVNEVVSKYHPQAKGKSRKGMHFQHGEAHRFRKLLSARQLTRANESFEPYLLRMGYET